MKVFLGFLVGAVLGVVVGLHGANCPFLVKLCPYMQGQAACVCPADCPCCNPCNCCRCCPCEDGVCKPQGKPKSAECKRKPDCCKPKAEVLPNPKVEEAPKTMPPAKD